MEIGDVVLDCEEVDKVKVLVRPKKTHFEMVTTNKWVEYVDTF